MNFAALALMSSGGEVGAIAQTFGVDWPHLVAQIISFCIVCFLLQHFAFKPVLNMLAQRRQQIAQSLADSEKIVPMDDGAPLYPLIRSIDGKTTYKNVGDFAELNDGDKMLVTHTMVAYGDEERNASDDERNAVIEEYAAAA